MLIPKIKYVIFDCDGVLVDSEILANRVEAEVKTSLGFPTTTEEQVTRFVGMGKNSDAVIAEMKRLPPDYLGMVDEKIHLAYENELQAIKEVDFTLSNLGLPKCVASSSEPYWIDRKLSITGLRHHFGEDVYSGLLVERGKPAPDLFLYVAKKLNWEPAHCLVIEDSEPGVQAGIAAGMTVCGFIGGAHVFPGHAEKLIRAGAHYIVSEMPQILRLTQSESIYA